jgi:hypothetical protein
MTRTGYKFQLIISHLQASYSLVQPITQHKYVKKEYVTHQSQNIAQDIKHPHTDSKSIVMKLYFC